MKLLTPDLVLVNKYPSFTAVAEARFLIFEYSFNIDSLCSGQMLEWIYLIPRNCRGCFQIPFSLTNRVPFSRFGIIPNFRSVIKIFWASDAFSTNSNPSSANCRFSPSLWFLSIVPFITIADSRGEKDTPCFIPRNVIEWYFNPVSFSNLVFPNFITLFIKDWELEFE